MTKSDIRKIIAESILADGMSPIIDLEKSHGSWLVDKVNGKEYLDLFSMFASLSIFIVTLIKANVLTSLDSNFDIDDNLKIILFIFLILIIYTHRKNISNLKNKTEQKIRI